jgi:16S rRNA (guanine527-N7)-methyltransferase
MPPSDDIRNFLTQCGFSENPSPAAMEKLYKLLRAANEQFNLTRITSEEDYWRLHIADSLAVGRACPELLSGSLRVADVGCGAGFPLLPLAWANPAGDFVGIEATGKKANFIDKSIRTLGLPNASVVHAQAREAARMDALAGTFDVVVFRAVAPTGRLLRDIRNLLGERLDARIIAYKTPQAIADERDLTAREASKYDFDVTESPPFTLPGGDEPRAFVILARANSEVR